MSSSTATGRNARARAPSPSVGEQAESARKHAQLAGWSIGAIAAAALLLRLMTLTARDVFVTLGASVAMPAARRNAGATPQQPPVSFSNGAKIVSAKVQPIVRDASTNLKRWRAAEDELRGAANKATSMMGKLDELQGVVGRLQENLAKSRSVGSVAGIRTYELEQSQAALKAAQREVGDQAREVLEMAERNKEEQARGNEVITRDHEIYQRLSPGRQRRLDDLQKELKTFLASLRLEEVGREVEDREAWLYEAVSIDDANEMANRVISEAIAAERAAPAELVSEEELFQIVRDEVLSVEVPVVSVAGCASQGQVTTMAKSALERYGTDKTGKVDYAMGPAGAKVLKTLTSETYTPKFPQSSYSYLEVLKNFARPSGRQSVNDSPTAISPDSSLGQCWPMAGSKGRLTVQLSETVRVASVSLEHASRAILLNGGVSAPKDFVVVGYRAGWVPGSAAVGDTLISSARYQLDGDVIQHFTLDRKYLGVEYAVVALEVQSNYGEAAYTCLYRFRVHGL